MFNMPNKAYIDFHTHSSESDGEQSPDTVIKEAEKAGISVLAITDHNRFTIISPSKYKKMTIVPGIEFSAQYSVPAWKGELIEVHVVGLFPNGVNPYNFNEILSHVSEGRNEYISAILGSLEDRGIHITLDEVKQMKTNNTYLSRQEIAKVIVKKGIEPSIEAAFDKDIGNLSPYYIPSTRYIHYASLNEIVKKICDEGGIAILAHPYMYCMDEEEMERLIIDFREAAGDLSGLEVFYEAYLNDPCKMSFLKKMVIKHRLLASAGSDRHRADQKFASCGDISLFKEMMDIRKDIDSDVNSALETHGDFEIVIHYKCRWCGKDTFRTPRIHDCKFKPDKHNCFSCKFCRGVEYIRNVDGAVINENEAKNVAYEKRFICDKGCDLEANHDIRTIWKLSQHKKWKANCPGYEIIPDFRGKETYLRDVVYKSFFDNTDRGDSENQF